MALVKKRVLVLSLNLALGIVLVLTSNSALAKEVNFKWRSIDGAQSYNLEVGSDESLSNKVLSKNIKSNSLKYDLKSGVYFMRVQAVDQLGRSGLWSKAFKLAVTSPVRSLDDVPKAKTVSFRPEDDQNVESTWEASEKTTSFHVAVEKDGKEILSQETTKPTLRFKPKDPGQYTIKVSAGLGQYYGPAVIVDTIKYEQDLSPPLQVSVTSNKPFAGISETSHGLPPPLFAVPQYKQWSDRKPIDLKWKPVPMAKQYSVSIYRAENKKNPIAQYSKIQTNGFKVPTLPPGRYLASVDADGQDSSKTSESIYQFDVKKSKPVEFEKFDFGFRYRFNQVNYQTNGIQGNNYSSSGNTNNNGQSNTNSAGGTLQFDGAFWFPDSDFGLKTSAGWGGFLVNNTNVTFNDLSLSGAYQLTKTSGALKTDIKSYLGARAMTFPVLVNNTNADGSNSVQVYTPTLVGPAIGFEFLRPLTEKIALLASTRIYFPLTASSVGSGSPTQIDSSSTSERVEIGISYAIPYNYRLIALFAAEEDKFSFNLNNNNNNNNNGSGQNNHAQATMNMTSVVLGIETSDGDPSLPKTNRFSEVDLGIRYLYTPANYSGNFPENLASGGTNGGGAEYNNLTGTFSGTAEIEADTWFKNSSSGFRLQGGWSGLTSQGTNISYPEFYGQWGLKPEYQNSNSDFQIRNYFGFRSWVVPHISVGSTLGSSSGTSGSSNNGGNTYLPQLVGLADTFQISKAMGLKWRLFASGELSSPLMIANKDSNVSQATLNSVAYKTELGIHHYLTEDLIGTLGVGYKLDQLNYSYTGVSSNSYEQVSSPIFELGVRYSF